MSVVSPENGEFERRWGDSQMIQFLRDNDLPEDLEKASITTIHLPCDVLSLPSRPKGGESQHVDETASETMKIDIIEQVLDYG